jgi:predicted phage terminase large subunit-like protein
MCEADHLFFTRYFFKHREGIKFRVNWHHHLVADTIQQVIDGVHKYVVINVPPGSSKTELAAINFIARGFALNPMARFLYLSYSDTLVSEYSSAAKAIIQSEQFQALWPLPVSAESNAKHLWNVEQEGRKAGGVYAVATGGQVTGFRAGRMAPDFYGAIIIDDPLKPEDGYSKAKRDAANRKLLTTIKSRKANPDTPIIVIMQRVAEQDVTGFIQNGNIPGDWHFVIVPALIDDDYVDKLPEKYRAMRGTPLMDDSVRDEKGRFSYWPYKEPLEDLVALESGTGVDRDGNAISRHVFNSQYQQRPRALGGDIIETVYFKRYTALPPLKFRKIYADTAQKTAERNDYSVFECWGLGEDGRVYLLDLIRGKWKAPELKRRAIAFWEKHLEVGEHDSQLRALLIEDKASGTGLIQDIEESGSIPVKGIERSKDKLSRVMDVVSYIEAGLVYLPERAPWLNDFIAECESFTADDTHLHDDQIDPMVDAINDMLAKKRSIYDEL